MASSTYDLSITEAAEIVGVHPDTLRAWADKGEVKSWKTVGGHRRFRRDDLTAVMPPADGPEAA